jgi:hypothetical protein
MSANSLPDSDRDLQAFVQRLEGLELANAECFLCANPITDGCYTQEHFIPAWVQRRHNLWNQRLVLLNGTDIPYRQLTVPCCDDCNRNRLRPIEDSLSQTIDFGYRAVKAIPQERLFLWLSKIFFGILYKELFLLLDRSDPAGPAIITPDFLRCYNTQRFFLQQAREKVRLVDFSPGSVFVFPMQRLPSPEQEWDLLDNVDTQFIGCRVSGVSLFASLGDGGAQQFYEDEFADIRDMPLHPLQFRELCAWFSYRSSLATRIPKYITIEGSPHHVHQMPLGGLSMKPLFEEGDAQVYAAFLHHYTRVPWEYVFEPPDRVRTWLRTPRGQPFFMDVQQYPEW